MGKKIAILTLPLLYNYGAILQAFALQKSVQRKGCECWLIDKVLPKYPYYRRPLSILSRMYGRFIKREIGYDVFPYWMSEKTKNIIAKNTRKFVETHITPKTKPILNLSPKHDLYDVYIVGSDQVWRKSVTLKMYDYLLGFVSDKKKKCSYAASFGVDKWEFGIKETEALKCLFKKLDNVTVREDTAINLLKTNIGIDAIQVLDPTLLLSKEDYCELITNLPSFSDRRFIFSYILDENEETKRLSEYLSSIVELPLQSVMPKETPYYGVDLSTCVYPAVEDWLQGFRDSDYVITDSFHGTVFSIIFNRPFFVLHNKKRGNTRLESLLRIFNLEDRIVDSQNDIKSLLSREINWVDVNLILKDKKVYSLQLLSEMIK